LANNLPMVVFPAPMSPTKKILSLIVAMTN
jgi:hypothetical protein